MSHPVGRSASSTGSRIEPDNANTRVRHKGRTYWEITKLVAKIVAGIGLAAFGMLCVASLVVGILLIINPTGFGIGNLLGFGLAWTGAAVGLLVGKAVTVLAGKAVLITVVSATGLGVIGALAAGLTITSACDKANSRKEEENGDSRNSTPSGSRISKNLTGVLSSDEEEDDYTLDGEDLSSPRPAEPVVST